MHDQVEVGVSSTGTYWYDCPSKHEMYWRNQAEPCEAAERSQRAPAVDGDVACWGVPSKCFLQVGMSRSRRKYRMRTCPRVRATSRLCQNVFDMCPARCGKHRDLPARRAVATHAATQVSEPRSKVVQPACMVRSSNTLRST